MKPSTDFDRFQIRPLRTVREEIEMAKAIYRLSSTALLHDFLKDPADALEVELIQAELDYRARTGYRPEIENAPTRQTSDPRTWDQGEPAGHEPGGSTDLDYVEEPDADA